MRKKNEIRRSVNAEKNKIWDKKCAEINTYIGRRRSTETWKFIKKYNNRERENNANFDNII